MKLPKGQIIAHDPNRPIILTASLRIEPNLMKAGKEINDGLMHFSFILTTAGANENNQYFIDDEIARPDIYTNPVNEAIDWDHEQGFMPVVGEITDSNYFPAVNSYPAGIRCKGVIFESIYPEIAFKVRRGAGKWCAVSMEALPNPLEKVGKYLVIHNPIFVGAGLVRFPGNKYSQIEEIDNTGIKQTKEITPHSDPLETMFHKKVQAAGFQLLTANLNITRSRD